VALIVAIDFLVDRFGDVRDKATADGRFTGNCPEIRKRRIC
jgi:hypothetical protein